MIVGNPMRRANDIDPNDSSALHATTFRCFNGSDPGSGGAVTGYGPEDSFELPNRPCSGGIRSNIYFPQYVIAASRLKSSGRSEPFIRCWDGVNLDSEDHGVGSFSLSVGLLIFSFLEPRRSRNRWFLPHELSRHSSRKATAHFYRNRLGHQAIQ